MKNKFSILFLSICILTVNDLPACDQCGCSVAGSYSGLMAFNTNNFIGLRFATYRFNSDPDVTGLKAGFQSIDLIAAFKMKKYWQVMTYLPYKIIDYDSPDIQTELSGIADAGILNTITIMTNEKNIMRKNTRILSLKAGLEFPTGKFNDHFRADHLPATIATGSGSIDLMTGLQYRFQNDNFNLFADYSFKHPLIDGSDYHFGGQHTVSFLITDPLVKNKLIINPYFGATSEFLSSDRYYEMKMEGTSGSQVFVNSGFEFQSGKWSLGLNYDIPLVSKFEDNASSTACRFATRLNYGF